LPVVADCLVPLLTGQDRAQAAWQAQADIFGETGVADQGKQASGVPKLLDISAWFDAARFLEELKPYINRMRGRMFMAFSDYTEKLNKRIRFRYYTAREISEFMRMDQGSADE